MKSVCNVIDKMNKSKSKKGPNKMGTKNDPEYERAKKSFLKDLEQFHESRGSKVKGTPQINGKEIDLYLLYQIITSHGGWEKINARNEWDDLLEHFSLPRGTNAGLLLKIIYLRHLELYEKIHYLGEDVDTVRPRFEEEDDYDDVRHRRRYNTPSKPPNATTPAPVHANITPVSDNNRSQLGMSTRLLEGADYDRLIMSLQSPLPNDQDLAISICTLLSHETKHVLKFPKAPRILDLLLAHAGVYNQCQLRKLLSDTYKEGRGLDHNEFWFETIPDIQSRHLLCDCFSQKVNYSIGIDEECSAYFNTEREDDPELTEEERWMLQNRKRTRISTAAEESLSLAYQNCCPECPCKGVKSENPLDPFPAINQHSPQTIQLIREAGSYADKVGKRITQITNILRNLSFEEDNALVMANNQTLLRFLLIAAECSWGTIPQLSLDMLGNVSQHLQLKEPSIDPISSRILSLITNGLFSEDRFRILRSLESLRELCKNEGNDEVFKQYLKVNVYKRLCELLTISDIMLLIYTLECLLSMTGLGEAVCNELSRVQGSVATLVSLVTVEAQSYGPKGCILMRVVETVTGTLQSNPAVVVQQQQSSGAVQPTQVVGQGQGQIVATTGAVQPSLHTVTAPVVNIPRPVNPLQIQSNVYQQQQHNPPQFSVPGTLNKPNVNLSSSNSILPGISSSSSVTSATTPFISIPQKPLPPPPLHQTNINNNNKSALHIQLQQQPSNVVNAYPGTSSTIVGNIHQQHNQIKVPLSVSSSSSTPAGPILVQTSFSSAQLQHQQQQQQQIKIGDGSLQVNNNNNNNNVSGVLFKSAVNNNNKNSSNVDAPHNGVPNTAISTSYLVNNNTAVSSVAPSFTATTSNVSKTIDGTNQVNTTMGNTPSPSIIMKTTTSSIPNQTMNQQQQVYIPSMSLSLVTSKGSLSEEGWAIAWLKGAFELVPGSSIEQGEAYRMYCSARKNPQVVLSIEQFIQCVKCAYGSVVGPVIKQFGGNSLSFIEGIRPKISLKPSTTSTSIPVNINTSSASSSLITTPSAPSPSSKPIVSTPLPVTLPVVTTSTTPTTVTTPSSLLPPVNPLPVSVHIPSKENKTTMSPILKATLSRPPKPKNLPGGKKVVKVVQKQAVKNVISPTTSSAIRSLLASKVVQRQQKKLQEETVPVNSEFKGPPLSSGKVNGIDGNVGETDNSSASATLSGEECDGQNRVTTSTNSAIPTNTMESTTTHPVSFQGVLRNGLSTEESVKTEDVKNITDNELVDGKNKLKGMLIDLLERKVNPRESGLNGLLANREIRISDKGLELVDKLSGGTCDNNTTSVTNSVPNAVNPSIATTNNKNIITAAASSILSYSTGDVESQSKMTFYSSTAEASTPVQQQVTFSDQISTNTVVTVAAPSLSSSSPLETCVVFNQQQQKQQQSHVQVGSNYKSKTNNLSSGEIASSSSSHSSSSSVLLASLNKSIMSTASSRCSSISSESNNNLIETILMSGGGGGSSGGGIRNDNGSDGTICSVSSNSSSSGKMGLHSHGSLQQQHAGSLASTSLSPSLPNLPSASTSTASFSSSSSTATKNTAASANNNNIHNNACSILLDGTDLLEKFNEISDLIVVPPEQLGIKRPLDTTFEVDHPPAKKMMNVAVNGNGLGVEEGIPTFPSSLSSSSSSITTTTTNISSSNTNTSVLQAALSSPSSSNIINSQSYTPTMTSFVISSSSPSNFITTSATTTNSIMIPASNSKSHFTPGEAPKPFIVATINSSMSPQGLPTMTTSIINSANNNNSNLVVTHPNTTTTTNITQPNQMMQLRLAVNPQNPNQQITFARPLLLSSGQQLFLSSKPQSSLQGQVIISKPTNSGGNDQMPKAIIILQQQQQQQQQIQQVNIMQPQVNHIPNQSQIAHVQSSPSTSVNSSMLQHQHHQNVVQTPPMKALPANQSTAIVRPVHVDHSNLNSKLSKPPIHEQQQQQQQMLPTAEQLNPYLCEWAGCGQRFKSPSQVFLHASKTHTPESLTDAVRCEWGVCDPLLRKRLSLMTHLQDRHCSKHALELSLHRRRFKIEPPPPPQHPGTTHPGYAPNAAFHAIKRHAMQFMMLNSKELMDDNEGPVTKSIRLTSALILKNLANYSSLGRRILKGYESQLASVAMSNVESSRTVAQLLYDMQEVNSS